MSEPAGWAKIVNLETQRMTGKYHYFKDGSSLCGKYIIYSTSMFELNINSQSGCKKCLELSKEAK